MRQLRWLSLWLTQSTRGGTIMLSHAPGLKRTPPTSPFVGPALSSLPFSPLSAPTSALPQPQPHAIDHEQLVLTFPRYESKSEPGDSCVVNNESSC